GSIELEHRHVPEPLAAQLREAATRLQNGAHHLTVTVGDKSINLPVEVGKSYPISGTGYTLSIENFDPAWSMFGTGELVKSLMITVTSDAPAPKREFRRQVLEGKDVQTDFELNVPGAPPMGKRQKEPIDNLLVIRYRYDDRFNLLPQREPRNTHS